MLVESPDGQRALLGRSQKFTAGMYTCLSGFIDQCESIEEVRGGGVGLGPRAAWGRTSGCRRVDMGDGVDAPSGRDLERCNAAAAGSCAALGLGGRTRHVRARTARPCWQPPARVASAHSVFDKEHGTVWPEAWHCWFTAGSRARR